MWLSDALAAGDDLSVVRQEVDGFVKPYNPSIFTVDDTAWITPPPEEVFGTAKLPVMPWDEPAPLGSFFPIGTENSGMGIGQSVPKWYPSDANVPVYRFPDDEIQPIDVGGTSTKVTKVITPLGTQPTASPSPLLVIGLAAVAAWLLLR